ncbi:MAG: endonuclease MutS2 [Candidatus Binatia bacterium]
MDLFSRTLDALDWVFVADALASHARTSLGSRAAAQSGFSRDPQAIAQSFDAIEEVHALAERRAGVLPVGGVEDIEDALVRAARGDVLDLAEIATVRCTLGALLGVEDFLARHAGVVPTLRLLGAPIHLDRRLCRTFETALDEHGHLSETAWPLLGELRRRIAGLERNMRSILEQLLESPEYSDLLQDRYVTVRGDRFVLPVKAQARNLGLGIVHDASRSERTVFVEPSAVVPLGNQRRMAEAELKDEERRILAELSAMLGADSAAVAAAVKAATDLDVVGARADFALRIGAVRPEVGQGGVVDLRQARHPVLALSSTTVVANDLRLDARRPVLVLTGPNAGGKTVAMKTIGLCALLVRAGCFVPAAAGSRVDLFDDILADIGDMQTVHEGLSSFSAHLTTLRGMLETAGPGSLLLLDEVAAGTDPAQGGALARAVIERLVDVGARVVATTHYTQVKAMAAVDERVEVSALEYRDGKPTYHVVAGEVGESHALAAAMRVGLAPTLVERARNLMEAGERALHDALAALEEEKSRAARASLRLETAETDLASRERALAQRELEIRVRAREIEKRAASATVAKLDAAEEEVRRALAALREETSRRRADDVRAAIGHAREAADAARRDEAAAPREPMVADRVRVQGLGVVGEVIAVRGDEIEVRAGAMTVRARRSELEVVAAAVRGARAAHRAGGAGGAGTNRPARRSAETAAADWLASAMRGPGNTLDLRGVRVEDGVRRLETFLDESMLEGREVVFVLHGHGSGAMKGAIRKMLAQSPYVSATSPAPEDQGGDALTVSRLRG